MRSTDAAYLAKKAHAISRTVNCAAVNCYQLRDILDRMPECRPALRAQLGEAAERLESTRALLERAAGGEPHLLSPGSHPGA